MRHVYPLGAIAILVLSACTHPLRVKNLEMYRASYQIGAESARPAIAVLPFDGSSDDLFFFNAIVERLSADPGVADLRTDYIPRIAQSRPGSKRLFVPDLLLVIRPKVSYRSSGWNYPITWPGFLIWAPALFGFVYHADLMTTVAILDPAGKTVDQMDIPMSLTLRHAAGNRTWVELGWLEVSAIPFFSGFFFATSFDREVIPPFQMHVKDTYSNHVMSQVRRRIQSVAASLEPVEPELPEASGDPSD